MSQDRDPRTDPRRGDVWRKRLKSGVRTREVLNAPRARRGFTHYVTDRGTEGACWITTWAAWTRGADLVKRGDA